MLPGQVDPKHGTGQMKRKRCKWQMQANTRQDARQTKAEEIIGEGGEGDRWREGEVCL